MQAFRVVKKPDAQIEFISNTVISIPDGRAAISAKRSRYPLGLREGFQPATLQFEFVGAIAYPDGQRGADRTPTIVVMVVTYPERLAVHFGGDCPAKARPGFNSFSVFVSDHLGSVTTNPDSSRPSALATGGPHSRPPSARWRPPFPAFRADRHS